MEHFFVGELEKVLVFTSSYTLYLLLSLYYFVQNPSILSFFLLLLFLLLNIPLSFFFFLGWVSLVGFCLTYDFVFFGRKGFDYYFSCEWGRLDGGDLEKEKREPDCILLLLCY